MSLLMEDSLSPTMNNDVSNLEFEPPTPSSKKRKVVVEKRVVRLRIGDDDDHKLSPPSDSWSWRKYGQKPIKGSPHPRGYYRCSTTKGCSAKKQVERCKSDASVLIVTYTSSHNHPAKLTGSNTRNPKQAQQQQISETEHVYLEQDGSSQDQEEAHDGTYIPNVEAFNPIEGDMSSGLVLPEQQSAGHVIGMDRRTTSAEVVEDEECYDFFDELEELWPTMNLFSYRLQERRHQQHQLVQ